MSDITHTDQNYYDSLPFWGYIKDNISEGFKTPAFKNGGDPHLQAADESEIVRGFELYDSKDDRDIIIPNNISKNYFSIVGKPLIHFFKPLFDDPIVGRRYEITAKLRQWLRREDQVDPSVAFDVLVFIGAPSAVIDQAIDQLVSKLGFKDAKRRENYSKRLHRLAQNSIGTDDHNKNRMLGPGQLRDKISLNSLLEKLNAQSQVNSTIDKQITIEINQAARLYGGSSRESCESIRNLIRLLGLVEKPPLNETVAKSIVRYVYFYNLFMRYLSVNQFSTSDSLEMIKQISNRDLDDVLNCSTENFLKTCLSVCSKGPPQLTKGSVFFKPGMIIVGEVVNIAKDYIEINNSGHSFKVDANFISTRMYFSRPFVGEQVTFSVKKSNSATCKGKEHIENLFNLFCPFDADFKKSVDIFLGASNSWAIIRVPDEDKGRLLSGEGKFVNQFIEIAGLRRATITEKHPTDPEGELKELKDFIKSSWKDLKIEKYDKNDLILSINFKDAKRVDARRMKTFTSMARKLYPTRNLSIIAKGLDKELLLESFSRSRPSLGD